MRQHFGNHADRRFDQDQACRFERFKKARRQTDRHAVLHPLLLAIAGCERDAACHRGRVARADVATQDVGGAVIADVVAGVDAADAARAVETDLPRPAGLVRGGDGAAFHWRVWMVNGQFASQRTVGKKMLAHRLESSPGGLSDQLGAETGAVDVEVGLETAVLVRVDVIDGPGRVEANAAQRRFHLLHAQGLRPLRQHLGQLDRVEMVGVVERRLVVALLRALGRTARFGHPFLDRHRLRKGQPRGIVLQQPIGDEAGALGVERGFEGMEELVAIVTDGRSRPVGEADALLEGRRRFADETPLIDAQELQGGADGGKRAFTHADDADLGRFDHGHFKVAALRQCQVFRQIGRGQPTRRAPADDQDASLSRHGFAWLRITPSRTDSSATGGRSGRLGPSLRRRRWAVRCNPTD